MNKRILITGASGLIGSQLVKMLLAHGGNELFIVGRYNNKKEQPEGEGVTTIYVDFNTNWNEDLLPDKLDAIIHLSQAENFRDFPAKAKEVFYINTISTLKLIDFAVKNNVKHFIYASSGGIYGNDETGIKEEQDIIYKSELGFYLGTKQCSEVVLLNYMKLLNVIILRFFFVYGKEQRKEMLIPRLVDFVRNGKPITLQGEEGMKMNPIHVEDAANAIIAALNLQGSHKINIAGPEVLSIKQIGEIIGSVTNIEAQFTTEKGIPAKNLIGDINQMSTLLAPPTILFKDGIKTLL